MKTLRYAKRLIGFESPSPQSNRLISKYLQMKLTKHGFVVEKIEYRDENRVRKVNLIAKKGSGHGGLAYFGHTDTVPADNWFSRKYGPFEPAVARERLYGRGSCDMKGSIACFLTAAQRYSWDQLAKPVYIVLTADEEAGFLGARYVVEESKSFREMVEHQTKGIIGEPTMLEVVHAHKGSCLITVTSEGKAAHSSTSFGKNANLAMIPFLVEMKKIHDETESEFAWKNAMYDPPTLSWNMVINDQNSAANITSPRTVCQIYTRPMEDIDIKPLLVRCKEAAHKNGLSIKIEEMNQCFNTNPNSPFVQDALKLVHRQRPLTVAYGTDGGIFTELENLIVFGPGNIAQAHTRDEWIAIEQLTLGTELYAKMIQHWCCTA